MSDNITKFRKKNRNIMLICLILVLVTVMLAVVALTLGAMDISVEKVFTIIFGKLTGNTDALASIMDNEIAVVWKIRLPRIMCSVFVGAGLAVGGVIFQAILNNPLADPYTLGVSTGAAFGASLAILLNVLFGLYISTVYFSFIFAFLTLIAVIFISKSGGGMVSSNLIISGIIVGAILSSGMSFMKMLAGENVGSIVFWLMGSLSARNYEHVIIIVPIVAIGTLLAFLFSKNLDIMVLGDKTARSMGVDTEKVRFFYLLLGSVITAACVSISGIIGFVGLVVPHILRFLITSDNRYLIPLSFVLGGFLLAMADSITRVLFGGEIPVGILTTLIGGPFFIFVFLRRKRV